MIYPFLNHTLLALLRLFVRRVVGKENLPQPPFIVAANHESYLDPLLIVAVLVPRKDKQVHFLAMKGRFWHVFGDYISRKWAGCVPLDEGKEKALAELERLLKKGDIVGIFPGGPRSLDGNLTRGRTGAVRLAIAARVPIVPAGIIGAYDIASGDRLVPRLKRAEIVFGKPIHLTPLYGKRITKSMLRTHTDKLMEEIAQLIHKKYVHSS